jgi:hypothetical protein
MEQLVLGLYVLSLLSCCVCLWFWYEMETLKEHITELWTRANAADSRLRELEKKKR